MWVLHHVQIIGEAASGLSDSLRDRYPSVPWEDIVWMRNVLVHQYFGVDLDQVWSAVDKELPVLKAHIQAVIEAESQDRDRADSLTLASLAVSHRPVKTAAARDSAPRTSHRTSPRPGPG